MCIHVCSCMRAFGFCIEAWLYRSGWCTLSLVSAWDVCVCVCVCVRVCVCVCVLSSHSDHAQRSVSSSIVMQMSSDTEAERSSESTSLPHKLRKNVNDTHTHTTWTPVCARELCVCECACTVRGIGLNENCVCMRAGVCLYAPAQAAHVSLQKVCTRAYLRVCVCMCVSGFPVMIDPRLSLSTLTHQCCFKCLLP